MTDFHDYELEAAAVQVLSRLRSIDPAGSEDEIDSLAQRLAERTATVQAPGQVSRQPRPSWASWAMAAASGVAVLVVGLVLFGLNRGGRETPVVAADDPIAGSSVVDVSVMDGFAVAGVVRAYAALAVSDEVILVAGLDGRPDELCAVTVDRSQLFPVAAGAHADSLPRIEPTDTVCGPIGAAGFEGDLGGAAGMSISPDGALAAFSIADGTNRLFGQYDVPQDIYQFDLRTGTISDLTPNPDNDNIIEHDPRWISSAEIVFYRNGRSAAGGELVRLNVATGESRIVADLPGTPIDELDDFFHTNHGMAVANGAAYVAYHEEDAGLVTFAAVDLETGSLETIAQVGGVTAVSLPAFTADGATLRTGPDFEAIYVDFATGNVRSLELWPDANDRDNLMLSVIGTDGVVEGGPGTDTDEVRIVTHDGAPTAVRVAFQIETTGLSGGPGIVTVGNVVLVLGVR